MDRYAVIGNPIGHSRSPRIHALFAEQTGQVLTYSAVLAPKGAFAKVLGEFVARGGRGVNVTVPFKLDAFECVASLDDYARSAGAVNTIAVRPDGSLRGFNTDGLGLVRDLTDNLGCTLSDARVAILGAGGAVRGILLPLLAAGVREIAILNRTRATADALVAQFARREVQVLGAGYSPFDVVLNGTSAGLAGGLIELPAGLADARTFAYDLSYGAAAQPFLNWARAAGARAVHDGLGMLVEQAAEAFHIWRGVRPATHAVISLLREELST